LLPKQILLTNLMTDFPEMNIASDNVDPEMILQPRRWNIKFIRQFMLVFGLLSSVFDYLTFGALLLILHASQTQFRTGWFIESVVSASLVVLVIRSRRSLLRSRPGKYLFLATILVVVFALLLPFTPLNQFLGFTSIPPLFIALIIGIVILYILSAELAKRAFYHFVKA
jgi:Mg2+-importing ATPase